MALSAPLAADLPVFESSIVVLVLALGITLAWLAHLFDDRRHKPY